MASPVAFVLALLVKHLLLLGAQHRVKRINVGFALCPQGLHPALALGLRELFHLGAKCGSVSAGHHAGDKGGPRGFLRCGDL